MVSPVFLFAAAFVLLPASDPGPGTDWSRFRGPNGTGLAPANAKLPADLAAEDAVAWRVAVPQAYSSPIVAGDRIFLTAFEAGELLTLAYALETGKELWRAAAPVDHEVRRNMLGSPAAPTPATDGDGVYVLFPDAGLLRYTKDGELVWRTPLGKHRIPHGFASSPVLAKGRVLVQIDADSGSSLRAYDAANGELLWETARPGVTYGYSTPSIHERADGVEVLVSGSFQIESFDLATGERRWLVEGACWNATPVPVVAGDRAYVLSFTGSPQEYRVPPVDRSWKQFRSDQDANGNGTVSLQEWKAPGLDQLWFLFDLNEDGELDEAEWKVQQRRANATGGFFALDLAAESPEARRLWTRTNRRGLPEMCSPVLCNGTLFVVSEGILTSLDPATGEVIEQERIGDNSPNYASPIAAGDRLLIASHSGRLTLVDAQAHWKVVATRDLDDEELWATPAIAGDRLIVRTQQALWCLR